MPSPTTSARRCFGNLQLRVVLLIASDIVGARQVFFDPAIEDDEQVARGKFVDLELSR
jgi:hypothetical protein